MRCEVEYTDEFLAWWETLQEGEQDTVAAYVGLLEERGTDLGFPFSSGIATSKYSHMRELRVQYKGKPYRVLYAFDPRRAAILLLGGCKAGNDRWYEYHVPLADKIYERHLRELEAEGKG